jgi:hypothetical protein
MYDRPYLHELIAAARQHLEDQVIPVTRGINHRLYFQTLVAANVLRIAERELALGSGHFHAQWTRLNLLMGEEAPPADPAERAQALAQRNARLCAAIRAGEYDDNPALFSHLKACATEQLEVANPRWLAQ